MENSRATYEGLLKLRPDERPFVLTRATYAGGQRYAVTWTGDNSATWNHLRMATHMVLNLGLSGISHSSAPTSAASAVRRHPTCSPGGSSSQPSSRSTATTPPKALAATSPGSTDPSRKPFAAATSKRATSLLPYIYTLADESSRTGLPMMRPVFLDYPEIFAPNSGGFEHLDTEFLLGPSLLIAPPPFAETLDDYSVSFPKTHEWYDFWTGLKAPPSPQAPPIAAAVTAQNIGAEITYPRAIHPPLETMPVYVRDGSIIPTQPLIQNTDETPKGPLELHVYPGPQCSGSLYLDDGHTFRYQKGEYLRQSFTCESNDKAIRLTFHKREGSFVPW